MKKKIVFCSIVGLLSFSSQLFSQELSKETISKSVYGGATKELPMRNQQRVYDAYHSLSEVYTLNFSNAVVEKNAVQQSAVVEKTVSKAEYVRYNNQVSISQLLKLKPEVLTVELPFKGKTITMDLVKADLFGENFQVNSNDPSKVTEIQIGVFYQGVVRDENSIVTFSFFQDEFSAMITTDHATDNVIEAGFVRTNDNTSGIHVLYADADLKVDFSHPCMSETLEQYGISLEKIAKNPPSPLEAEKALVKCVTYFWETSYNMYQTYGTTQAVTNYMTTIFNNFQVIYNNESVGSKLNQLYVWTSADPYGNDLNTFSSNRSGFGANLATLFSTTGGGGVAWLDQLCGSNEYYKHGFCGSIGGNIPAVPNYSWPINVSTHEVGHNLGSPHTHACTWSGGAIDGCGPTAGYSEGCTAALPSGGGTIMSYCHLLSTGINFNNGFGPQPGNLIRSRVNSCITLTCETNGGGSTCASSFEPNETQATAIAITSGTTNSAAISSATDIDYYKLVTGSTSNNTFNLVGPAGVDYDLVIYNSGGTQIGAGTGATATETVALNSQAAGTYYIKVFGYSGANSATCYTINATAVGASCATAFESNETQATAATIASGATNSAAISTATDIDYFKVVTTGTANNTYSLVGPAGVDFDMTVYNSAGTQIGAGTSGSATETVTINSQVAGTYYVKVFGYNGANSTSCYTIRVAPAGALAAAAPISTENELTLYPNPTTDKLNLGGVYAGKLMNQLGQTVLLFDGSELSLKELKAGVYLLQVEGDTKLYRVIKE